MTRRIAFLTLIALIAWKAIRTDWIVECDAAFADFHLTVSSQRYTASYTPPVSPVWVPPDPEKITGRQSATWRDHEFFDAGGSYGPVSEPVLQIHWKMILAKLIGTGLLCWLLAHTFSGLSSRRH
jgi:hypothetical protein